MQIVLTDAYVKGVRGNVNWDDGYAAMVKNAEVPQPRNNTPSYGRSVNRAVE